MYNGTIGKKALFLINSIVFITYLVFFSSVSVWGQVNTLTGIVSASDTHLPLPGVNVTIKGTSHGTITDLNGKFSLAAETGYNTLVFSFIGYKTSEVEIGTQSSFNIVLEEERVTFNEVVVVGYGSQKAKDLTAPIVSVKGDELSKQVSANPMQALQGKVAGLQIINDGSPGSSPTVKIRGVGSIGDYANPLYVVDGVFVDNIDFLGSGDIEDITILKDASAAAIYGVRAANGVILVTTRKGKTDKPTVSYDGYVGLQVPVNILPMATKDQYVTLLNEANANIVGYVPKVATAYPTSTDWYQQLVRVAPMENHNIDISGSTDKTSYSFGGSYFAQQGIMNSTNDYQRFNIRGRLDQKVNKYLKIGVNSVVSSYDKHLPDNEAFFGAYVNPPVYNVYDNNNTSAYPVKFGSPQTYGFGNQYGNPFAEAYYYDNYEKGNKLIFSAYTEFTIIENKLTFKTAFNEDLDNWNNRNYTPQFNVGGSQGVRSSTLDKTYNNASKQIIDNLLTFKNSVGKSDFSLLLGQSTRIERSDFLEGSALDVPGIDNQAKYISLGSFQNRYANDGASLYNGLSFFTRGTYNYNDKFLATFTFRADASSKYQDKWGYFPSLGLGYNLTDESFIKSLDFFQYLKVRASWGLLGNDNVPANSTEILGETGAGASAIFGNQLVNGIGAQTVVQNYLKWEVVNEFDLGFDFAALNNKLTGEVDYYHRVTNNVVFSAPIATGGGVAELLGNNGSVLNSGVEMNLNWKNTISDNLSYHFGLNATYTHNEVLALHGRDYIPSGYVNGNYTTRTAVGHPIGSFYGYEIAGVYATEGQALTDPVSQAIKDKGFFKYKDQNGDKVIDDKDRVYLGSPIPWLITGLDAGLNYKKFDVSLSFQGQFGNKILNAKRMNRAVFADGNYDQDFYNNRWTSTNKSSTYPSAEAYNYSFTQQANTFFVEDGSYIRIQNIQLGYTTTKIKFIPSLRVYISIQRPYTFFTYKGFTPEIGGSPISSGIDNTVYPMQAIYTFGIKTNF